MFFARKRVLKKKWSLRGAASRRNCLAGDRSFERFATFASKDPEKGIGYFGQANLARKAEEGACGGIEGGDLACRIDEHRSDMSEVRKDLQALPAHVKVFHV